jgi:hypothetical protein
MSTVRLHDSWSLYWFDLLKELIHILDPLYEGTSHVAYLSKHGDSMKCLLNGLRRCGERHGYGWNVVAADWEFVITVQCTLAAASKLATRIYFCCNLVLFCNCHFLVLSSVWCILAATTYGCMCLCMPHILTGWLFQIWKLVSLRYVTTTLRVNVCSCFCVLATVLCLLFFGTRSNSWFSRDKFGTWGGRCFTRSMAVAPPNEQTKVVEFKYILTIQ